MEKRYFYQSKIYENPHNLLPVLDNLRQEKKIIVFGNGCFDLLHVGHIRYLYSAKELGDVLIMAVNTDESMQRIKPDREPVTPDYERLELIASIEAVNYVVPLEEDNPISLLKLFKPHIHTNGTDYIGRYIPEREFVVSYGGKVVLVGDLKNHSTSEILRKIRIK